MNRLYYGDNLDILRRDISDASVDLVYLDPPFNSNRGYNLIFARHDTVSDDAAQIQAFDDTWRWTPHTDADYADQMGGGASSQTMLPTRWPHSAPCSPRTTRWPISSTWHRVYSNCIGC